MTKIGILGSGNMAQALAKGWINHNQELAISSPRHGQSVAKQLNIKSYSSKELVEWSEVLVLAFLPQQLGVVASEIETLVKEDQIIISVLGGTDLEQLSQVFSKNKNLVRILPNTNVAVNEGEISYVADSKMDSEKLESIIELLNELGMLFQLPEDEFSVFSTIAGSGPAIVAKFAESLVLSSVKNGLSREEANLIVIKLIEGTIKNVQQTGISFNDLIYQICSPGGSTIKGIESIEKSGFAGSVMKAIDEMF